MVKKNSPLVSVGIPTYNRPDSLRKVLYSLLNQSYENYEIIISDNASDHPDVKRVVEEFLEMDKNGIIRYYRQPENRGAAFNFKFVLDEAKGDYFMWNADDDLRSSDFIELNTDFLEQNPQYAASTSPNALVEHFDEQIEEFVTFDLTGERYSRCMKFFENALTSHGIFYSQFRTDTIKKCPFLGKKFIATDWALILCVLSLGPIARLEKGYILSSRGGISESENHFRNYRLGLIDDIVPMYRFYHETKDLYSSFTITERLNIFNRIMKFNQIYYSDLVHKLKRRLRII